MKRLTILVTLISMFAFVGQAMAAEITIEGNDAMQYNLKEFEVKAGETVKLTLKHSGKMPKTSMGHNIVILKPGTNAMSWGLAVPGKGGTVANGYIPTDATHKAPIIAYSKMLGGGESVTIEFTAPAAGEYPFVCTFPGHVAMMRGVMKVK